MTLTTHIIIASAVARPLAHAHPSFIFLAGLASHYLSDAIPHWDYKLGSIEIDENSKIKKMDPHHARFFTDIAKTVIDMALGIAITALIMQPESIQDALWFLIAALGGVLPDALQGVFAIFHFKFMRPFQKFHDFWHTKIKLGPYPKIGIPFQLAILLFSIWFLI